MKQKLFKSLLLATGFYLATSGEIMAQNAPVNFSYDFSDGTQGWEGDFADYPIDDSLFYNLNFAHAALPDEIDSTQKGLLISGDNRSDDLFLFIKKKITGLEPMTNYNLVIDLEMASNGGTNTPGIGGAKGLSEYLKIGATDFEPKKIVLTDPSFYEMNLDKSNQGQSGTDMVLIGTIAVHEDMDDGLFRLISRGNAHAPFTIKTNANGEAWVIIGTDSGFEGLNIMYYNNINLSFSKKNNTPCASKGLDTYYEWIDQVHIGGINNTSGNDGGYGDYTNQSATLATGVVYYPYLNPGFAQSSYIENWKVWVDFNKDGQFSDVDEVIFSGSGNGSITGIMALPASAQAGETTMRVSMRYGGEPFSCGSFLYGEVEDYTVTIVDSSMVYCQAVGQNSSNLWIESANINGSSSNFSGNNGGYADFTSISTTVKPGYPFYLIANNGYTGEPASMNWAVYADWNQDGNFSGNELIHQNQGGLSTEYGHFYVPTNALEGKTRLRFIAGKSQSPDGCTNVAEGEIEDYEIFVSHSGSSKAIEPVILGSYSTEKPGDREINIFPSPAKGYTNVTITRSFKDGFTLEVYDLTGRNVYRKDYGAHINGEIKLNLNEFKSGKYQLIITPTNQNSKVFSKSFEVIN